MNEHPEERLLLESLLEASVDGILAFDRECRYTAWNRAMEHISGVSRGEALGRCAFDVFPFLRETGEDSCFFEALSGRGVVSEDRPYEVPETGRAGFFEGHYSPVYGSGGEVVGGIAVIRDITKRRRAQEAAREAHRRLTFHVENSPLAVIEWDSDFRVSRWSPSAERLFGWEASEVLGKRIGDWRFVFAEDLAAVEQVSERQRRGVERQEISRNRNYRKDGTVLRCDWYNSVLCDEAGTRVSVLSHVLDVTAAERAEAALRESEDRYRDLVENSHELICTHDLGGRILSVNRWAAEVLGYEQGRLVGMDIRDGLSPERRAEFDDYIRAIKRDGFAKGVMRVRTAAGEVRFWEYHNTLRVDGVEEPVVRGMAHDVTERRQALAREKEARKEAEAANRLKDEFLATLSHELRTPLTAILGWAYLLRSGDVDAETAREAIRTIERNASNQQRLINDLLDVSRIITGNLRLNVRPVTLAPVVEAAIDSIRPAADIKDIRIRVFSDPNPGLISGDPERLQQVLWNLLSNAVKFTPEGGVVEVRLERTNTRMVLIVSDTGQGISPEFLPYVFDRFRQADGSTTRAHGGLGLGLSIVRHLVESHGGSVKVESGGRGRGATLSVMLPLLTTRQVASAAAEVAPVNRPPTGRTDGPGDNLTADLRVLVVDDDEDALALMKVALGRRGARVTTAASAAEALRVLGTVKPDVMICDIGMPQMDGYELIRRVRALPPESGGSTPAVALTAYARDEDKQKALAAGFQAHVAKPVTPDELVSAITGLEKG